MAAGTMVKQFLIDTTKTAGQTQDITDANILGQPKAILFFATGPVSNHQNGAAGNANRLIGWAADTTEGGGLKNTGLVARSANGVTTTAENGYNDTGDSLNTLTGSFGSAIDGRAKVSSMLSNGFRLTYDEQFSLALSVVAVVLWGTDFSNIEMGTFSTPNAGTTPFTQDYGPAFVCSDKQGIVFMMGSQEATAISQEADSDLTLGLAASSSEQACFIGAGDNALALPTPGSENRRHASALQCYAVFSGNKNGITRRAAFNTWLGSGGFQLTWNAITAVSVLVHWLVIKGGQWSVKTGTAPASGTVDVTGAGFDPIGGLVLSQADVFNGSANSHSADIQESYGAFDAVRNAGYAARNLTDQTASTVVAERVEPDKCYLEITTSGGLNAAMSAVPITNGARFTVTTGNPNTHNFAVALVGQNAAGGGGGTGRPTPDRVMVPKQRLQRSKRW